MKEQIDLLRFSFDDLIMYIQLAYIEGANVLKSDIKEVSEAQDSVIIKDCETFLERFGEAIVEQLKKIKDNR